MRPSTQLISLHASRSPLDAGRALVRRPLAVAALAWLAVVLTATLGAPWLAPADPLATDPAAAYQGPSTAHWLGTDQLGRDLLSRIMAGGAEPLLGVAIALTVSMALGVTSGVLAGYLGGAVDWLTTRWAEVTMALPGIIILLVVLAVFPHDSTAAMIAYGVLLATPVFRVVRASTLAVRPELHVDAARTVGLSTPRIVARHILPRIAGAIMVQGTLVAGAAVLLNTSLGFLGFGPRPPAATWGSLISDASTMIAIHPWLLVPTGGVIILTVLSLHVVGDTVREVLVERWQGRREPSAVTRPRTRSSSRPAAASAEATPGPDDPLLEISGLRVRMRANDALLLDAVSFRVGEAEIVGLVGESGCGKSLTGKAVLRLLPPGLDLVTGSSIVFGGTELADANERTLARIRGREIAHIAQDPMTALDPTFTIGAQLGEVVTHHEGLRGAARRERVRELLAAVRIRDADSVARRYPHQISGGMAQRVSIARAIAGRPRLLIADEPTTALDVTVQTEVLDLLRELRDRLGMAIILISHDWGVIAELCDRALVMYAGQIVESASTEQLHESPRHPYAEALQASNPHYAVRGAHIPALPGQVPQPSDWPRSCRFADRCRYAAADCREGPIPLLAIDAGRTARCLHSEQVGGVLREQRARARANASAPSGRSTRA